MEKKITSSSRAKKPIKEMSYEERKEYNKIKSREYRERTYAIQSIELKRRYREDKEYREKKKTYALTRYHNFTEEEKKEYIQKNTEYSRRWYNNNKRRFRADINRLYNNALSAERLSAESK